MYRRSGKITRRIYCLCDSVSRFLYCLLAVGYSGTHFRSYETISYPEREGGLAHLRQPGPPLPQLPSYEVKYRLVFHTYPYQLHAS